MITVTTGTTAAAAAADPLRRLSEEGVSVWLDDGQHDAGGDPAAAEQGVIHGDTVTGGYAQAHTGLAAVEALGVSYDEVVRQLEEEGVAKFAAAWQDLLDAMAKSMNGKGVDGE